MCQLSITQEGLLKTRNNFGRENVF
jgi:hypothetical protein